MTGGACGVAAIRQYSHLVPLEEWRVLYFAVFFALLQVSA